MAFVKRPHKQETDDDIMHLQDKFLLSTPNQKTASPKPVDFVKLIADVVERTTPPNRPISLPQNTETTGSWFPQIPHSKFKKGKKVVRKEPSREESPPKWVHFDTYEPEKLKWITEDVGSSKDECDEIKFNVNGVMLCVGKDVDDKLLADVNYSMPELFRMSRSTVAQQRIFAMKILAKIVSNYDFQDQAANIEALASKIFFLFRFAFDENNLFVVEAALEGFSALLLRKDDEDLLDLMFETAKGAKQPYLNSISENVDLAKKQDFELAEYALEECLFRTRVYERIRYIMLNLKPPTNILNHCLRLIVYMVRLKKNFAIELTNDILFCTELMRIIELPFTKNSRPNRNDVEAILVENASLAIKIVRLVCSFNVQQDEFVELIIAPLWQWMLMPEASFFIVIPIQIEILRLYRTFFLNGNHFGHGLHSIDLRSAILLILSWYIANCHKTTSDNNTAIHLSALLWLCEASEADKDVRVAMKSCLTAVVSLAAMENLIKNVPFMILCGTCCDIATSLFFNDPFALRFAEIVAQKIINSGNYEQMTGQVRKYSRLSTSDSLKCLKIVPSLFSELYIDYSSPSNRNGTAKNTIINSNPFAFSSLLACITLNALLRFLTTLMAHHPRFYMPNILKLLFNNDLQRFVTAVIASYHPNLILCWFVRCEIDLLLNILRLLQTSTCYDRLDVLGLAFTVLHYLSEDRRHDVRRIFDDIIFAPKYYLPSEAFDINWKRVYAKFYGANYDNQKKCTLQVVSNWNAPLLPKNWTYDILISLLKNRLDPSALASNKMEKLNYREAEFIIASHSLSPILESMQIVRITETEQLIYLMLAYLGVESKYLQTNVKSVLDERVQMFCRNLSECKFDFSKKFKGVYDFKSLFTHFLEEFQASSYGDEGFSTLLMIPLAQKYDHTWRSLVWSEHVPALSFVRCPQNQLVGGIAAYLEPVETDEQLINAYKIALSTALLRPNTLAARIARHHLQKYYEVKRSAIEDIR